MTRKKTADLSGELETGRLHFERWRERRRLHTPIPESLWAEAVKLASRYGVSRTARALRVGYYSLKERGERAAACSPASSAKGSQALFLELAVPPERGTGECVLEWEDVTGAKMRVRLQGMATSDLVALSRSFWEGQR
ncbi:MAG: hypothetical protein FJ276_31900 [Planctomycetes bacterium]|nr:hypothetical protein [Planctomycetota bacterium]